MSRIVSIAVFLASMALTTSFAAAQGIYWETTSTGGPPAAGVVKNFAVAKKFKQEDASRTIILRLDKEAMYMVDPKRKTYMEMSFGDMEKMAKQASEQIAAMKARLKDMPAEQRAVIEKQFEKNPLFKVGEDKDAKVEVEKSADTREILGRACRKHVARENGKEILSAWVTDDFKEFAAIRKDWVEVMRRMGTANPMLGKNRAAAFEKIEGFPLETEMNGVKTTVTKVETRAIADADFDVPAGFTKQSVPSIPAGLGPGPGGAGLPGGLTPQDREPR